MRGNCKIGPVNIFCRGSGFRLDGTHIIQLDLLQTITCGRSLIAQYKVSVHVHQITGIGIISQHTSFGIEDIAGTIHHLQVALTVNGNIQATAGALKAGLLLHGLHTEQRGTDTNCGGVCTSLGRCTTCGSTQCLIINITENSPL